MAFLCCFMCGKGSEKYLIVCSPVAVNYWNVGISRLSVFRVGSFVVLLFWGSWTGMDSVMTVVIDEWA